MMYAPPNLAWPPMPLAQPQPQYEPGPAAKAPHGLWTDRFGLIFGVVITTVAVVAVVLGALAPTLAQHAVTTAPSGWSTAYNATPAADAWETSAHCAISAAGLDVTGTDVDSTSCRLKQSTSADLTSEGLIINATLAPGADFDKTQSAFIRIGANSNAITAAIEQTGNYVLSGSDGTYTLGSTIAWHADANVANTVSLRYLPGANGGQAMLSVNGQEVAAITADAQPDATISLGATPNDEALYTHVALYSASATV